MEGEVRLMGTDTKKTLQKPYALDLSDLRMTREPRRYTFANDTGDAEITVHQVFPGITLSYNASSLVPPPRAASSRSTTAGRAASSSSTGTSSST